MRMMLWAALALGAVACGTGMNPTDAGDAGDATDGTAEAGVPSFAEVQMIFSTSCAVAATSCHASVGRQAGLDLSAGVAYGAIVGRSSTQVPRLQLVNPGNPDQSYLLLKIGTAYQMLPECQGPGFGPCGTPMPMVGGSPLSPTDRDTIRRWIAGGAPM